MQPGPGKGDDAGIVITDHGRGVSAELMTKLINSHNKTVALLTQP